MFYGKIKEKQASSKKKNEYFMIPATYCKLVDYLPSGTTTMLFEWRYLGGGEKKKGEDTTCYPQGLLLHTQFAKYLVSDSKSTTLKAIPLWAQKLWKLYKLAVDRYLSFT